MKKPKLNALQVAQLSDIVRQQPVKINRTPRSLQKGHTDTPLFFRNDQTNLFK
ncbi:MAG: hypothetical protein QM762_12445 [Chryseolinea sp.]